jgi:hypothetical protein
VDNGKQAESGTAVTMEGVDLEGDHRAAKRMHIYRAMLQRMSDEQRIQVRPTYDHISNRRSQANPRSHPILS